MAISQIWAVKSTPVETLKYIARFDKSDNGALVFSNQCSNVPELANMQMTLHRKKFGKDSGILLHHGFVSFKKDEVDRETAYKFAREFMDKHFNNYQYFGSIHVDTDHIHFNFAINSVGFDGYKYNGCKNTLALMRADVDRCCQMFGLSVVKPKGKGVSYKEWEERKNNNSWKSQIKVDVDLAISKSNNFEEFLEHMKTDGYFVKQGENVKHILFKKEGMTRGCRGKTLGEEYTEEAIKHRIKFKEFDYQINKLPSFKKPKMKPIEKELMKIYYRRPTMSTSLAMGIHLLNSYITGNHNRIVRYSKPKKKKVYNRYREQVKKLSGQMNFCYENNLKNRDDIKKYQNKLKGSDSIKESEKQEIEMCNEILKSLDEIKERDIVLSLQNELEENENIKDNPEKNMER